MVHLLWRPGGPGRRPIITFRRQIRYKYLGFGPWAIFNDVKGRLDFVCFFIVFRSVVFANRGGEFLVKQMKVLSLGQYVIFKKSMTKK